MEFLTTNQAAMLWGISARRVALLCEKGRIKGAIKVGKMWLLPIDAQKPVDKRFTNDSMKRQGKIDDR